jgi:PAS domain S-box-containing protein
MARYGRTTIRSFIGSNLLLCVLGVQVAFVMAIAACLHSLGSSSLQPPAASGLLCAVAGGLALVAGWAATRGIRIHGRERDDSRALTNLMETLSDTSGEWLWAVDGQGNFSFSSRASTALLGYEPAELIGRPINMVIDQDELVGARQAVADALGDHGSDWAGVPISYRHRTSAPVWMEVSGRARPSRNGASPCYEGTSRSLPPRSVQPLLEGRLRERIHSTVAGGVLTAFQPIYELATGTMTGVEALTRFPRDDGRSPDRWFSEATSVGLGGHLEFAALEAALGRSAKLPEHLYVALNISPDTCLNPMLPVLLKQSGLAADRIILELTERTPVDRYAPLLSALAPLRQSGLRIAVDDAGSGFASMRHILRLRPDIIKLDRSLITGIDSDPVQWALGAAMVQFARETGVQIVAEGIETQAELAAVSQLGMTSVQGYFLGRPSLHPADWEAWKEARISGTLQQAVTYQQVLPASPTPAG